MNPVQVLIFLVIPACVFAQFPELEGPTTLGSGKQPSNSQQSMQTGFRPYITVNQIYDSGLPGAMTDSKGALDDTSAFGLETEVGIGGYHRWKRTLLGLDYRGDFRRYTRKTTYGGSDQFMDLSVSHQLARHIVLGFKESGGTFTRGFGLPMGLGFAGSDLQDAPSQELLDNRIYYLNTQGEVTYLRNARLAFGAAADGFLVRRQANALLGLTGYVVRGDVTYRLTRYTTIGAEYDFTHFASTHYLGVADLHMVSVNYAVRLSRTWEVAVQVGTSRIETLGVVRVNIDPAVAAIIGQQTGLETTYQLRHPPGIGARLAKSMGHGMIYAQYRRGVTPGNGLWLASATESINGGYTYSGMRKWNIATSFGYSSMGNLLQSTGSYHGYHGSISASRQLDTNCRLIMRLDSRQYDVTTFTVPNRRLYRVTFGIEFSPGNLPIS